MKLYEAKKTYSKVASIYDHGFEILFDRLLFFDEERYRTKAVDALNLVEGDSVLDIGCGTGRNFHFMEKRIGSSGRIVGLDYSNEMLKIARHKVLRNGWINVELIHGDAQRLDELLSDQRFDGIISTFCLSIVPEWCKVIHDAVHLLKENRRFVILDFNRFGGILGVLSPVFILIALPFGAGAEGYAILRDWEGQMERNLRNVVYKRYYVGGTLFLTFGEK